MSTQSPGKEYIGSYVGSSPVRLDADAKLRGQAQYVDDETLDNAWYGAIVRSPIASGTLDSLEYDPDFDWDSVVVVTAEDVPGRNNVQMHSQDMPLIAEHEINYIGEPLALVAAPDKQLAEKAAARIMAVLGENDNPVITLEDLVERYKAGDPSLTIFADQVISKGSLDKGFAAADELLEREYWTGYQEQLYIEPQGMYAAPDGDGVLIVGSMQCPYYINTELSEALDLPIEKIRVRQAAVGGAFGGKEEFPSFLAGYCALLALKSGKTVKIVYDRHEDIMYTTKRHPAWMRYRAGFKTDGTLTAMDVDYLLNAGGYGTLSPVVLARGILHTANGYRCDHVHVRGVAVKSHTYPSGAFRGFGAPQAFWGLETFVDEIADVCGMSPHVFRRKNCLVEGDSTPTGQVLKDSVGSPAVIERALETSVFADKLSRCSHGDPEASPWYGIGMSFFPHGAGFTGDGEARIQAKGAVDLDWIEPGKPGIIVRVSSTEMGQGAHTALAQVAASAMSVDLANVACPFPDTKLVPNSGPTVASRTAMVVGNTVHRACLKLKSGLESYAAALIGAESVKLDRGIFSNGVETLPFEDMAGRFLDDKGPLRAEHVFELPADIRWNQETFEGDAYPSYSWGCNIAEVEIDPLTLQIKITRVWGCFDIGRVINPLLAKGQLEGGLTQALGYAVMENMDNTEGHYDANRMQTYVIPTMLDVPEYILDFVEYPYDHAAPGAKGVGEIPMDGLAPAIGNAIYQASGLRLRKIPILPEGLFEALSKKGL